MFEIANCCRSFSLLEVYEEIRAISETRETLCHSIPDEVQS